MKKMMIELAACALALAGNAGTEVYRLERNTETDALCIVGADGVRRPVAIVDPDEYAMLTGHVDQVWRSLNSTRDGRQKLHGPIAKTEVDETRHVRIETHRDGYRFEDAMPVRVGVTRAEVKGVGAKQRKPVRPTGISSRQWKMRLEREAAGKSPVKEVTVEHDAATGKDIVK